MDNDHGLIMTLRASVCDNKSITHNSQSTAVGGTVSHRSFIEFGAYYSTWGSVMEGGRVYIFMYEKPVRIVTLV